MHVAIHLVTPEECAMVPSKEASSLKLGAAVACFSGCQRPRKQRTTSDEAKNAVACFRKMTGVCQRSPTYSLKKETWESFDRVFSFVKLASTVNTLFREVFPRLSSRLR